MNVLFEGRCRNRDQDCVKLNLNLAKTLMDFILFLFWGNRKNQKPRFNHSYNFILIKPCFWPSLVWIQYGGQKTDDIRPSTHRSDCGIDFKHVFENFSANNSVRVKNSFVFELLLFDCQYIIIYLKYSLCFYANSDTSLLLRNSYDDFIAIETIT